MTTINYGGKKPSKNNKMVWHYLIKNVSKFRSRRCRAEWGREVSPHWLVCGEVYGAPLTRSAAWITESIGEHNTRSNEWKKLKPTINTKEAGCPLHFKKRFPAIIKKKENDLIRNLTLDFNVLSFRNQWRYWHGVFLPLSRYRAILFDMRYTMMRWMVVEISPLLSR